MSLDEIHALASSSLRDIDDDEDMDDEDLDDEDLLVCIGLYVSISSNSSRTTHHKIT